MVILMLFLVICQSFNFGFACAETTATYFARIMTDNAYLYIKPIETNMEDFSNIYFKLPKSYFIKLTDSYNSQFYLAQYLDITGYVKKDDVQSIVETPKMPYLNNISFRVYNEISRDMRKQPSSSGGTENHVAFIQLNSQNLTYYGEITGESLNSYRTNIWYYCKYTADKDYYGYVYSDYCDDGYGLPISLPLNTEEVTYTTSPDFHVSEAEEITSLPVESKTTWIVVMVLSVPAIIFLIMILKTAKFDKANKIRKSEIKDY